MKYVKQVLIILLIAFNGELLKEVLPFPIPANIYGILLLFLGLETKLIPLRAVKETGSFFVEIMPVLFIPAGVGLMDSWSLLQANWIPYVVMTLVTTVVVMAVAGRVTQWVLRLQNKEEKHD